MQVAVAASRVGVAVVARGGRCGRRTDGVAPLGDPRLAHRRGRPRAMSVITAGSVYGPEVSYSTTVSPVVSAPRASARAGPATPGRSCGSWVYARRSSRQHSLRRNYPDRFRRSAAVAAALSARFPGLPRWLSGTIARLSHAHHPLGRIGRSSVTIRYGEGEISR